MARRTGEPSTGRASRGKNVSPAVAVIVIVIVLALVAAVWLQFTKPPPGQSESEYQIDITKLKPGALQTPEAQAALKKVQEEYIARQKEKAAGGSLGR